MNRRRFLRTGVAAFGAASAAGCLDLFETQSPWADLPMVEDRPDNAVYVPAGVEEMEMYGTGSDGDYSLALFFTFPHRFWTVESDGLNRVDVQTDDHVHLMVSLWDRETDTVLPVDATLELTKEGDYVTEKALWPMLSQSMGFHYGDNFSMAGDGMYEATVRAGPVTTEKRGKFEGRLEDAVSITVEFSYEEAAIYDLELDRLSDREGNRGAVQLTTMDGIPTATIPPASTLPGKLLGSRMSGDGEFVVTLLNDEYLAVLPSTPYNRIILPMMSLSATVERNGDVVFDRTLQETLDPAFGYHYGIPVDDLQSGDEVTVSVNSPPQVSRHDGYETAFFDMEPITVTV